MSALPPADRLDAAHPALELAAEWFALLRSGDATEADRASWQAWLAASEENRNAWQYVERISGRASCRFGKATTVVRLPTPSRPRAA